MATSALFSSTVATTASPTGGTFNIAGVPLDATGLPFLVHPNYAAKLSAALSETYKGTSTNFTSRSVAAAALGPDETIYFGSDSGYLHAFKAPTTTAAFEFAVRNTAGVAKEVQTTPAIGQAGSTRVIYFAANDGKVHAVTSAGTDAWDYALGGDLSSSPALDCKGIVYVGTNAGKVHALITDSDGPANSSWPKFQHDNRNTGSLTTPIYSGTTCVD